MPHLSPPSVPSAAGWVLRGWQPPRCPGSAEPSRVQQGRRLRTRWKRRDTAASPSVERPARPTSPAAPTSAGLRQVAADICASPVQTPVPPISFTPGNSPHLIEDDRGTPGHTATFAASQTPDLRVPAPLPPSAPTPASSEAGSSLGLYDFTPASHQPVSPLPWISTALTL